MADDIRQRVILHAHALPYACPFMHVPIVALVHCYAIPLLCVPVVNLARCKTCPLLRVLDENSTSGAQCFNQSPLRFSREIFSNKIGWDIGTIYYVL